MTLDKKLTTPFTPGFKESLSKKQSPIQLLITSNYWNQLVILTLCESQILPVSKKPTAHHKEEESEKLNFHFWGFWSQPGQPEKVEILPCESLFHEIWHGSLQPLAYPHLLYLVGGVEKNYLETFSSFTVVGFSTHSMKPERCRLDWGREHVKHDIMGTNQV